MTDAWQQSQQRTHNLHSFTRMQVVWFPVRRVRGRKYKFEDWQIELAQRVLAEQTKEEK